MKILIASILMLTLGYTSCNKKADNKDNTGSSTTATVTGAEGTAASGEAPKQFDAKYVEEQLAPIFEKYKSAVTDADKRAVKDEVGRKVNELGAMFPGYSDHIFEVWLKLLNNLDNSVKADSSIAPPGSGKKMSRPMGH